MPTTTTTTTKSRTHNHHHQRQVSAGAGAQLVVVLVVLVLDFEDGCCRGLWYLVPATWYAAECNWHACFSQDDLWYLVSRPFNITKLRELGAALNTTSRGG